MDSDLFVRALVVVAWLMFAGCAVAPFVTPVPPAEETGEVGNDSSDSNQ